MSENQAFVMMSDFLNLKPMDVVVPHMNTLKPSRLLKRLTVGSLIAFSLSHAAIADDVNLKTMIPGVPDIDAEAYVLIDYNSGKVLAEKNADARRDPASLTKMMTSYVIGQAVKAGKIHQTISLPWGRMRGRPVIRYSKVHP